MLLSVAVGSVLLRIGLPPATLETVYSRGVFPVVRWVLDYGLGWLPVPLFYVFWLLVPYVGYRLWRAYRGVLWLLRQLLLGTAVLVSLFLWMWGFNYGRTPVEERLGFPLYQPELEELRTSVYREAEALALLRRSLSPDTVALDETVLPADLEAAVRPLVARSMQAHGYLAPGRPRAWQLYPRGVLLRLSTAGVYWPWAGQGNTDAGLHPLQQPAVLAHELSHAYGFGDEGTCSFWAVLAAEQTEDTFLQYALRLAYWRQLAGRLRYADPENYLRWRAEALDPGIRNDLEAIYANGAKYQDIAPALRDATYTAYLKAQGIHEGLLNYARVVQLVEGYRRGGVTELGQRQTPQCRSVI